jgi:hypothetical protein
VSAALLVVGCSSGGGRIAVPNLVGKAEAAATQELAALHLTPMVRPVASTASPGTVVSQAPSSGGTLARNGTVTISVSTQTGGGFQRVPLPQHVVANLGPCPSTPDLSFTNMPSLVQRLRRTLVAIAAQKARICEYGGVPMRLQRLGQAVVPATLKLLENTANRRPTRTDATCDEPANASFYVVTFANSAGEVNVVSDPCGSVTNFVRSATSNARWLDELRLYTMWSPAMSGVAGGPTG